MSDKRKKENNKTLQVGKGYRRVGTRSPIEGEPNTNLDFYDNKTGEFVSRRKFNSRGKAEKDLDKGHKSHNKEDHAHDFGNNKRGGERPLLKKEKREIKKASKKRRFQK